MPKHWRIENLGDVCDITMGQSPPSSSYNQGGIGLPFFQGKAEFTKLCPQVSKWCSNPRKIAFTNDVLISVRAPVGDTNIASEECGIGRGLAAIRYRNSRYLLYFLRSIHKELENQGTGTTFQSISGDVIRKVKFPVSSIEEENAIVGKIEELFNELDKGIAHLTTVLRQLGVYKQGILNSILEEANLQPIESVIEQLDQGWSPKCLNKASENEKLWAVIKTSAIQHGHFLQNENKVLPENMKPRLQHELNPGDILITRAGPRSRVGVCCMARKVRARLINSDKVYRIKVNKCKVLPEYFEFVLNTPTYLRILEDMKTGISDSGVNLTQKGFLKIKIPIPDIPRQRLIIQELSGKLDFCKAVEGVVGDSLYQTEALRQAILKKAFEGKLIAAAVESHAAKIIVFESSKDLYYYQVQVLGLIVNASKKKKILHGEMTVAKYMYLVDKVFDVPTYYDYQRWHLGPYPPAIKKAINNKKFFRKNSDGIGLESEPALFENRNPYQKQIESAVVELTAYFSKYTGKDRSDKTELLATVCKVVEDIQHTELKLVRKSMAEWKVELKGRKPTNKAEKFTEAETKECLKLLKEKGWDKKLLRQ